MLLGTAAVSFFNPERVLRRRGATIAKQLLVVCANAGQEAERQRLSCVPLLTTTMVELASA